MKKLLSILLLCLCFSANAQWDNGIVELEDFEVDISTSENMSVIFLGGLLNQFSGARINAFLNGNPVSYGTTIDYNGVAGLPIIGDDGFNNPYTWLPNPGDEINFYILISNTIVELYINQTVIYYTNDVVPINSNIEFILGDDILHLGCMNSDYIEYSSHYNLDNGLCVTPIVNGCMDANALNFNSLANTNANCEYPVISGCTSVSADNFNIEATQDDGSCQFIISIINMSFDAWKTSIILEQGWNIIGYGCPVSINIIEGLSNYTEQVIIIKDNNGLIYMPEYGFNGIGDFTPGFGYQIKLIQAIEDFSLCDWYVNDIPEDNIVSLQEENASLQAFVDSVNAPPMYQVGDYAEGGIVFYVDLSGEHGLVAAINNVGEYYEWGCSDISVSGADEMTIGSGFQNTMDIINQDCTIDSGVYTTAAEVCYNLQENGYDDWYLPSSDELLMMSNISNIANFIGLNCWLWSSTEYQNSTWLVWVVCPLNGDIGYLQKNTIARVRPIRSF